MWDILKFLAYQRVWTRFGNTIVVFNTSFKMRQMQNNLIKMCIQSMKWNLFWAQLPAVMKCTSMQLSNKAVCNQPMLLPLREQRKCELFIILTVLQFFVYCVHNPVFLQNPALKVNLESNCKCRGKCAISCAFTSGQLITCDYKHAVDCGGGARPHEGFVWN